MQYSLKRSWRKTLSVTISRGKIFVRAPYLTPRYMIDAFLDRKKSWINKKILSQKDIQVLSQSDQKNLREQAVSYIPNRTKQLAQKFGKNYNQIKITSAKTRWGSCTSQKNLNFSYRLMACPRSVIDYVIIHELAHLKEMNHSKKFWQHVSEMKPDYLDDEAWLKTQGKNIV